MKKIILLILCCIITAAAHADTPVTIYLGTGYPNLANALVAHFGVSAGNYEGEPFHLTVKGTWNTGSLINDNAKAYWGSHFKVADFRDMKDADENGNHIYLGDYAVSTSAFAAVLQEYRMPLTITGKGFIPTNKTQLKLVHISKDITEITYFILSTSIGFEKIYMDNSTAFATNTFNGISSIFSNITLYIPEGATGYESTAPWSSMQRKYRRQVIFHSVDGDPKNRVSFTYKDESAPANEYWWYSNVDELMEFPQLDSSAVEVEWYKDEELATPWNFEEDEVEASPADDSPVPLHLYAKGGAAKKNVTLHWGYDDKVETKLADAGTVVATLVPPGGSSRKNFVFKGWYTSSTFEEGTKFEPGGVPHPNEDGTDFSNEGVIFLTSDLTLYAYWVESPWLDEKLLVEIPEGGTFETAFNEAIAPHLTNLYLSSLADLYAIAQLEIRGATTGTEFGDYRNWYHTTLGEKVVSLDLREATLPWGNSGSWYHYVFTYFPEDLLQEIRLPIDGSVEYLGSPFGHTAFNLKKIYFPASLKVINPISGHQCSSPFAFTPLTDLYFDSPEPPTVPLYLWHAAASNITIHVPEEYLSAYEGDVWGEGYFTPNGIPPLQAHTTTVNKWEYSGESGEKVNTLVARPKVTFHTNGGARPLYTYTDAVNTDTYYLYVDAGSAVTDETLVVTKEGHDFAGWYTDAEFETAYAGEGVALGLTDGFHLYAKWNAHTFTVTFDAQGGTAVTPLEDVAYGSTITAPDVSYEGYDLDGWYTISGEDNVDWTFATSVVTSDTTLYAKWTVTPTPVDPEPTPVPPVITPSAVLLDQSSITLKTGDTQTLAATVTPQNADDKSVSWTSSDNRVATVSSSGVVTAVAPGTATITVTTAVGNRKATCTVTVEEVTTGIVAVSSNDVIVSSDYYTVTGMRVKNPAASGVYIRRDTYASGKSKAKTVFIKR